jgi:hypothetical protein
MRRYYYVCVFYTVLSIGSHSVEVLVHFIMLTQSVTSPSIILHREKSTATFLQKVRKIRAAFVVFTVHFLILETVILNLCERW